MLAQSAPPLLRLSELSQIIFNHLSSIFYQLRERVARLVARENADYLYLLETLQQLLDGQHVPVAATGSPSSSIPLSFEMQTLTMSTI